MNYILRIINKDKTTEIEYDTHRELVKALNTMLDTLDILDYRYEVNNNASTNNAFIFTLRIQGVRMNK